MENLTYFNTTFSRTAPCIVAKGAHRSEYDNGVFTLSTPGYCILVLRSDDT